MGSWPADVGVGVDRFSRVGGHSHPQRCRYEGIESRCGTLEVAENRAAPDGRRLRLSVTVIPAVTPTNSPPLFVLHGGPGAPASDLIQPVLALSGIRQRRDLVFINQRGTAGANRLTCAHRADRLTVVLNATRCLADLAARADLRFYRTTDFIADLEEARRALGYQRVDLLATSYGTRAAAVYAKLNPESLRSIVMLGPDPPTHALLESAEANMQQAIDKLGSECRTDARCRGAYPQFVEQYAALQPSLSRMEQQAIVLMMFSPTSARRLPWLVSRMANGDRSPLQQITAVLSGYDRLISLGVLLTFSAMKRCRSTDGPHRLPR